LIHVQACGFVAAKNREIPTQKAHLYEAIFLFNQGTDDAVRGLEKLRKAPGFTGETYGDTLARLEHVRAQINLQFLADTE